MTKLHKRHAVDDALDMVPPQNLEAEKALLGGVLADQTCLAEIAAILGADDFCSTRNRRIFEAMLDVRAAGMDIDLISLRHRLDTGAALETAGGLAYLAEIADIPSAANWETFASIVLDCAGKRRLAYGCLQTLRDCGNGADVATLLAQARERLGRIAAGHEKGASAVIRCAADVETTAVRWLWPGRIPAGKLALLVGYAGVGKSLLTADIAARLSLGAAWPDHAHCEVGSVVLLSGEDDPGDTIVPRLKTFDADLERVHILDGVKSRDPQTGQWRVDLPALDGHGAEIRQAVESRGARLLVIDPISSFVGRTDDNKNAELRRLLSGLARMAADLDCAVLAVTHIRKAGGLAVNAAVGSLAYTAAARAAWALTRDPDDSERRLLLPIKNNLAKDVGGLGFRIVEAPSGLPRLAWEADAVHIRADDVLCPALRAGRPPEERNEAREWLLAALSDGPRPSADLFARARGDEIAPATLKRAKAALGVSAFKTGFDGGWSWRLPEREQ